MNKIIEEIKRDLEGFAKLVDHKQFEISRKFYPYKEYKDDRKKYYDMQWPNADKPGVYVFISDDDNDKPLYIGKGEVYLGNRIWSHLGSIGKGSEKLFPHAEEWVKNSREKLYFITIPVKPPRLAPALESFLIYQLEPLYNIMGK